MKKLLGVLLLLLAGCQRELPAQRQSVLPQPRKWEPPPPLVNYYEGSHAAEAVQMVRAKVGEPFRVLNIRIDNDEVRVQVQDPKKPENVDEYSVAHGRLDEKPTPVRLFGDSDQKTLNANVFDPATVDLTKVADLIREGNEKIQLEGREMTGLTIERDMFNDGRVIIDVNYHGTRKSGYLRTDRKGAHAEASVF